MSLTTETIEVFHLLLDGREIAIGLSEDKIRASIGEAAKGYEITRSNHQIVTVNGNVYDWSRRGGHSFNLKLHWCCPKCGAEWWDDFVDEEENPMLAAGALCDCASFWRVYWNPAQVEMERSQPAHRETTED